jgi:stearoyl-CoA desaturase (delta-9 desaturase)
MQTALRVAGEEQTPDEPDPNERVNLASWLPFTFTHLTPLAIIWTGISWGAVLLCFVLYEVRMFFITAGYHRYFAHNSYRLNRFWQFVMALGGTTALQQGPLWWAALHRDHHRNADTPRDIHSPLQGFWWSHVGWLLRDKYRATRFERIEDFAKYPELRWLDRFDWVAPAVLGGGIFLVFGLRGLVVGFLLSTVLLWHGTFLVNSVAHVYGRRRYVTRDSSRNSLLVALVTNGEGWHNNHHYLQSSARQGFFWWEIDLTYYLLVLLRAVGIVHDLRQPPARLLRSNLVRDTFDVGMFDNHLARAGGVLADTKVRADGSDGFGRDAVCSTLASTVAAGDSLARQGRCKSS